VPKAATARAALPILSVIEAVVLGLTTRMRMMPSELAAEVEMPDSLVAEQIR